MARFCTKCGSPVSDETVFCGACGADLRGAGAGAPMPSGQQAGGQTVGYTPVPTGAPVYGSPGVAPPAAAKSGSALKAVLIVLGVLFVCGLVAMAGVFYVAHRVAKKIQSTVAESGFSSPASDAPEIKNACRLLSTADVGAAIGVPIVATNETAGGCEYLAKGTAAQMTAKHMSALMKARGADDKSQELIEKLSGGVFSMQQNEPKGGAADEEGNTVVLAFTIDPHSARAQMRLNSGMMRGLGPGSKVIPGIGDEAFDAAGAMLMVRKGDELIRITYTACPCSMEAVEPLAKKLTDTI